MKDLIEKLRLNNQNCSEFLVDFSTIEFKSEEDSMGFLCPGLEDKIKVYNFKDSASDSKDPKAVHAQKQFCKIIGIPYSFFMNNRPSMRDRLVKSSKYALEAVGEKKVFKLKVRESDVYNTVRAVVASNHVCFENYELLELINDIVEEPFSIDFVNGVEKDDIDFHARFLLKECFEVNGEKFCVGFSLCSSELGGSDLVVEALVHNPPTETSYVSSYSLGSYFSIKYDGNQKENLKQFLTSVVKRIVSNGIEFKNQMQEKIPFLGVKDTCRVVSQVKKIPPQIKKGIYQEASENGTKMGSNAAFAKILSGMSKKYDFKKRIEVERLAGSFLNLNFNINPIKEGGSQEHDEDDQGREEEQGISEEVPRGFGERI